MPAEVRAAAGAADHDVRLLAGHRHLLDRLLPDHRLVQQDVVQDAAQRVLRVLVGGGHLDRLADRDPQAAGRVRVIGQDLASGVRLGRRRRGHRAAEGLDEASADTASARS